MIHLIAALALGQTPAVAVPKGPVYEIRTYFPHPGCMDRLHARFRDHTIRIFRKHGIKSIGYWTPVDDPESKLVYVVEFAGMEARTKAWDAMRDDPVWSRVRAESERDGPIVRQAISVLLKPTDYSPLIRPTASREPRLFELRTYAAAPGKLDALHARFRDHTVRLFRKHGMQNIGYWTPVEPDRGADNLLVYLLAHKNLEAAQQSWAAFLKDPAWIAARDASEKDGSLLESAPKREYLKPTPYSPTR